MGQKYGNRFFNGNEIQICRNTQCFNSLLTIGFLMVSNFEKEHWLNEYHVSFTP